MTSQNYRHGKMRPRKSYREYYRGPFGNKLLWMQFPNDYYYIRHIAFYGRWSRTFPIELYKRDRSYQVRVPIQYGHIIGTHIMIN